MKHKLVKRLLIASLLVSALIVTSITTAYANEDEESVDVGDPPSGENVIRNENEVEIDIDTPASVTGERMEGNGTVVDFTTSGSKAFYTIVDNDQQTFYLIIDMDKPQNNVYFLSDINRAELGVAAANTPDDQARVAPTPPNGMEEPELALESEDVTGTTSGTDTDDNNLGFLLTVVVIGIVGAFAYFFLVVKKKQTKNKSEDNAVMSEDYEDDFEGDMYEEDFYEEDHTETEQQQQEDR
ncbi:CD1107 family mobile element protein [Alkalihalobacillus sp. LMS39]|uniref:CD1107 family mobile element protein n=1 Tax=Alkalihalobacillus sp. LMS39 TaxID=2924032 RepID=UPI001FB39E09|nr:DUF4366 domain-containing protein [Alkalihalobacillus sp. LMS39]UOE94778.1 DUF4366 domain-containing protein [Alkalihalobacillus sp. LMS39]